MDAIPNDLARAAFDGRDRLARLARDTAAQTDPAGRNGSMAAAARTAIFTDALMAAMHARLQELKNVAK
ncbi:MAG: hypothetical protein NVS2B8_08130 [Vulcanimicrobiaceae bacterium]